MRNTHEQRTFGARSFSEAEEAEYLATRLTEAEHAELRSIPVADYTDGAPMAVESTPEVAPRTWTYADLTTSAARQIQREMERAVGCESGALRQSYLDQAYGVYTAWYVMVGYSIKEEDDQRLRELLEPAIAGSPPRATPALTLVPPSAPGDH